MKVVVEVVVKVVVEVVVEVVVGVGVNGGMERDERVERNGGGEGGLNLSP